MPDSRHFQVLVAGAGPAGLATGLHLLRKRPELRGSVVILEKSSHPRFKTCAGGLIPKTMLALESLGLALDVPAAIVMRGTARTDAGEVRIDRGEPLCTIIRRDEFDARLARAAREAGIEIIEHCRVQGVVQNQAELRLITDIGEFNASVLVGADGSGSRVRAAVFGRSKHAIGRALMTDIPIEPRRTVEFSEQQYRFDFGCVSRGIRGYAWSFPCYVLGQPHLNVGIYDQHPRGSESPGGEQAQMVAGLARAFPDLELSGLARGKLPFRAFPIRWFDASDIYASGRVILAGDAAGVDPLMGEGISCAFEHGQLAAAAILRFLDGDRSALREYDLQLHRSSLGRKLRKLAFAARRFYGPRHRHYFRLAHLSRRAQEVGIDWYNGAGHMDELSTAVLLRRWAASVLFGSPVR